MTGGERREEVKRLARRFAAHLRHLREFRGVGYVTAAPTPRGTIVDAVVAEPAEPARTIEEVASSGPARAGRSPEAPAAADVAWPSGQVTRGGAEASARPRADAPTWPKEQPRSAPTPSRPAAAEPTGAPAATRLPIVDAAAGGEPAARADVRPADGGEAGLRAQAQAWTPEQKLAYLRTKNLGNCTRCKLARSRTNIVFGVGDPAARLMFIGEAPGADEDRQGEPFVGAAGKRLTQWIERLGMTRPQVYIANVLKCRPPGNRDPEADEIEKCSPFLRAQIRAIGPEVIVALGRYAGILLLGTSEDTMLKTMRARAWTYEDAKAGLRIPLYVTYHPSYVIRRERELPPGQRNPADDTVMSDLERALRVLHPRR